MDEPFDSASFGKWARESERSVDFDVLLNAASEEASNDKDTQRRLRLWAADCAAHVLRLYQNEIPDDDRVRACIEAARQAARGEIRDVREIRKAAKDAADEAPERAAKAAAKAAASAAWGLELEASSLAVEAAVKAAIGVATVPKGRGRISYLKEVSSAAKSAEEKWQHERLILWLDDPEPAEIKLDD